MSHPWNKSLRLQVNQNDVRATLHPSWWQRRGGTRRAADYPSAKADLAQPLALTLEQMFDDLLGPGAASQVALSVTVADAYAHFDVVAGDYAAYSDQQLQSIALGCVAELLGDAASHQLVRWQLQPDMQHLLLCALEEPLVQAVLQTAQAHRLPLVSLQPAFCRHWNRHLGAPGNASGVFAVADAAHQLVACTQGGSITALSYGTGRTLAPGAAQPKNGPQWLDQRVDRLLASIGQSAQAVASFVLVARDPRALALAPRWSLRAWQEETP